MELGVQQSACAPFLTPASDSTSLSAFLRPRNRKLMPSGGIPVSWEASTCSQAYAMINIYSSLYMQLLESTSYQVCQ